MWVTAARLSVVAALVLLALGITAAESAPLGTMDGSISVVSQPNQDVGNTVDLSAEGTADWAIWGTGTSTSLSADERKSGSNQISVLSDIPGGSGAPRRGLGQFTPDTDPSATHPFAFSWTDGAPTASGTQVRSGLQHDGQGVGGANGAGFSFTVPADQTTRTLKIWVALNRATGQLTASLSDNSAPDYVQSYGTSAFDDFLGAVYMISYAADGPDEELTVTWQETTSFCDDAGGCDNVSIHAVVLEGPGLGGVDYVVNSTDDVDDDACDAEHCSLREAINAANGDASDSSTITFDLEGDSQIGLVTPLPQITDSVVIDGSTSPSRPVIFGQSLESGNGLVLAAGATPSRIAGLEIHEFPADGIVVGSSSSAIDGNLIFDTRNGIVLGPSAANNTIGGRADLGAGNQIFTFTDAGVAVVNAGSGNRIQGNTIGLNGELPAAGQIGISVSNTPGTVVGDNVGTGGLGSLDRERGNVVVAAQVPQGHGIALTGAATTGTIVTGNYVGVDRSGGATGLGNEGAGIHVTGASGNQLGPGNIVTRNGSSDTGIHIASGSGNRIVANSIVDNGGKGIELDVGANGNLLAPTLASATGAPGGNATVSGSISGPTGGYFVEFFKNAECDGTPGGGEGETYAGFANATITEIGTTFSGTTFGTSVAVGDVITATLTGASTNNTSEFSNCVTVQGEGETAPPPVLHGAIPLPNTTLGVAGAWDSGVRGVRSDVQRRLLLGSSACTTAFASTDDLDLSLETNDGGIGAFAIDGLAEPSGRKVHRRDRQRFRAL